MIITLIRKLKGNVVLKELEEKYGSFKELERLYKETGNMLMLIDLENWKYFQENPDETLEQGKSIITDQLTLTNSELNLLNIIKKEQPKSIRDLARKIDKDVSMIHPKVKELEQEGLIELKEGDKNSKIPIVSFDEIKIAI
jgi:DNA-binding MarR family transcriptional regulator